MSLFPCQRVQPEDGKFQFGVARIAVLLILVGSKVLDEAVDVLHGPKGTRDSGQLSASHDKLGPNRNSP